VDPNEIYLTRDGFEKLEKDLEYLEKTKRREIARALEHARALGDLSENAEYDAAKNEQAHCEHKIGLLKDKLSRVRIINMDNSPKDQVFIGAKVSILDLDTEEELVYTLVSKEEADYESGRISIESPVGRGLMRHKEGEVVEISIPAGILKYKILKIN
jgi:transcription elongation factor GreA